MEEHDVAEENPEVMARLLDLAEKHRETFYPNQAPW
jgi:hypothetical protein